MQNTRGAMDHLRTHQKYPASKADLVAACNNLSDFSEEDKREFENNLSDKTYYSAEELIGELGWS